MTCPKCSLPVPQSVKFCPSCGTPVNVSGMAQNGLPQPAGATTNNKKKKFFAGSGGVIAFVIIYALIHAYNTGIFTNHPKNTTDKIQNYFGDTNEWKSFTSGNGSFKVMFPIYPNHSEGDVDLENGEKARQVSYVSDKNNTTYFVFENTYPASVNFSEPKKNLENALNAMGSDGTEILSSSESSFGNYPSLDFKIMEKKASLEMRGKMIIVGHNMFHLMVAYKPGKFAEADYNKFINSFQLMK